MLRDMFRKKSKNHEDSGKSQLSREDVGARLKGMFGAAAEQDSQAYDERGALKQKVASAAAAALEDDADAVRVERAGTDIGSVARSFDQRHEAAPARPGTQSFHEIGRSVRAHLDELRRANAEIREFLEGSTISEPTGKPEEETDLQVADPEQGSGAADNGDDEAAPVAVNAGEGEAESAVNGDRAFHEEAGEADEESAVSVDALDAEPEVTGTDDESASEVRTKGSVGAPSMAPAPSDIAEENTDEDAVEIPVDDAAPASKPMRPRHQTVGDHIASLSSEEHEGRLQQLEAMVTAGVDEDDEDVSAALQDGYDGTGHDADEDEAESHFAIPLLLSREVVEQEEDRAAHELNAQICDFLLFDAGVLPDELSRAAYMGWAVDFFWRNAGDGGVGRFAHLAASRPDLWGSVTAGLEAIGADEHLRVVEALQALVVQDDDLARGLEANEDAGEGVEIIGQLDEAFSEADEQTDIASAMGEWLKAQHEAVILETDDLQRRVSAYADAPHLTARRESQDGGATAAANS